MRMTVGVLFVHTEFFICGLMVQDELKLNLYRFSRIF